MDSLGALLPILLIGVVFYLLIMRPARNRQKQQQQLMSALAPGAQIMTTAGLFGTVITVDDDEITLEVAPGVVLRMVKAAVARVIDPVDNEIDDRPLDDRLGELGDLSSGPTDADQRDGENLDNDKREKDS